MKLSPQLTIKIKAVLSSILLIAFIITTVTGIGLWAYNAGRLQYFSRDSFFGFNKHKLGEIHTTRGFIMSGAVIIHLFFNFKMFVTELKMLFKK